jgi:hypothetical protein
MKEEKNKLTIGSKFGKLTIIESSESILKSWGHKNGKPITTPIYYYKCKCDCGNIRSFSKSVIKKGHMDDCGCTELGIINYKGVPRRLIRMFKGQADVKGKQWDLNIKYLGDLFEKQNGKCFYTGWDLEVGTSRSSKTASLDRIDSSKGYIEGNVQWVHKDVNIAKNALSHNKFLIMCAAIAQNTKT